MIRISSSLFSIACLLIVIGTTKSATCSFAATYPNSPVAGKIVGVGDWTIDATDKFIKVELQAITKGGGPSGTNPSCTADETNETWDGTIDSMISKHTYTVYANLVYIKGTKMTGENSKQVDLEVK